MVKAKLKAKQWNWFDEKQLNILLTNIDSGARLLRSYHGSGCVNLGKLLSRPLFALSMVEVTSHGVVVRVK